MLKIFPKIYSNDKSTTRTVFDIRDLKTTQPSTVYVDEDTVVKKLRHVLNKDERIDQLEQKVYNLDKLVSGNIVLSTGLIGLIIWSNYHN